MLPRFALLTVLALAGCTRHLAIPTPLRAPNPNGCYATVYERPSFDGAGDVLNGPAKLSTLERLPSTNEPNWNRRIRSLRVGPRAAVTAYVETSFKGHSQRFGPATEHPQLEPALSSRIQSLEVACVEVPGLRQ